MVQNYTPYYVKATRKLLFKGISYGRDKFATGASLKVMKGITTH
jgi:hypothetical protein